MPPTDVSEKGFEGLLVAGLCAVGWQEGNSVNFLPVHAIDIEQFRLFILATQPQLDKALDLANDSVTRQRFLDRLDQAIASRGIVDVLRKGVKHGAHEVTLFYGAPSPGNTAAKQRFDANRFVVVRQLHYSSTASALSLDVCLMVNGLPVVTMELKNTLTKQTVADAVQQYMNDRDPRERIFSFKRALVHFAVDDQRIEFCTKLEGRNSWFMPFDKGFNQGAGNPPNPNGLKTAYLWEEVLAPASLTNIIENYAQLVQEEYFDRKTKKTRKREKQIWPRYHQLDVVRELLADVGSKGAGEKYLIQHSAGSGKSNSIAWLVHQLVREERSNADGQLVPVFDSVIVVTNRRLLTKQIGATIKQFVQVGSTVGQPRSSSELAEMISSGKKVIITTIQKFPHVVNAIGDDHRDRTFAIVIDEAHDSQSGRTAASLAKTLQTKRSLTDPSLEGDAVGEPPGIDDEDDEDDDPIQDFVYEAMAGRKMATNASYFAFTATPKNKTLEMFGVSNEVDGKTGHVPFHVYSMKQAIEEGFILDVLSSYTTISSYYRLTKTIEDDPEFDAKRAKKKLHAYVESNDHAIAVKAGIMVDHFLDEVIAARKLGGEARAMVVCGKIRRALQYFEAISEALEARDSQYQAIVAFSSEHDYGGKKVSEASLNGFPSGDIEDRIREDPYRILVCADKYQTGYDEPLLHTMYVDKVLSGVKAVQTLSRLNRADPRKREVFVLDFQNDTETIRDAFQDFYQTTVLADETDPNKLHDLKARLDAAEVYDQDDVAGVVHRFLAAAPRAEIDPILDRCAVMYSNDLDEDGQVSFKGDAKTFVRTYDFLSQILSFGNPEWEKLAVFLTLLVDKLHPPEGEDLAQGILNAIDMESYRSEKQAAVKIALAGVDGELQPVPMAGAGGRPEPEMDRLSNIVRDFNDLFGNIDWADKDRILRLLTEDLPARVNANVKYRNAKRNSDRENARVEHDRALESAVIELMNDDGELFKRFMQDDAFKKFLRDTIFELTYTDEAA